MLAWPLGYPGQPLPANVHCTAFTPRPTKLLALHWSSMQQPPSLVEGMQIEQRSLGAPN